MDLLFRTARPVRVQCRSARPRGRTSPRYLPRATRTRSCSRATPKAAACPASPPASARLAPTPSTAVCGCATCDSLLQPDKLSLIRSQASASLIRVRCGDIHPCSIWCTSTTFLPHMPSGIHTPSRQARNPAAILGLLGSTAAAASAPVIVSQSAGFHIGAAHGVFGRHRRSSAVTAADYHSRHP